jgi:hypothetical protein
LTEENKQGTLSLSKEAIVMTAALGALPFLATLWLLVVLGAIVLEESGAKIAAALKGKPVAQPSVPPAMRVRVRWRSTPSRGSSQWRAAA